MKFGENPAEKTELSQGELERGKNLRSYLNDKINNGKDNVVGGKAFANILNEQKLNKDMRATLTYENDRGESFEIEIDPGEILETNFGENSFSELQKRFEYLGIKLTPESMVLKEK